MHDLCERLEKHFGQDIKLYFLHLQHLLTLRGHNIIENLLLRCRIADVRYEVEKEISRRKTNKESSEAMKKLPSDVQEDWRQYEFSGNILYDIVARTWYQELNILTFCHKVSKKIEKNFQFFIIDEKKINPFFEFSNK
jgi:hypothetical protein